MRIADFTQAQTDQDLVIRGTALHQFGIQGGKNDRVLVRPNTVCPRSCPDLLGRAELPGIMGVGSPGA